MSDQIPDFNGHRICNVPDNLGDVGVKWPFTDLEVFSSGMIGGVNLADATEVAIKRWNEVCGIHMRMSTNPRTAHIVHGVGMIDGPGNVLAQHQLPVGFSGPNNWRQLQGTFDLERVVLADNPPSGFMDIGRICTHEVGHGLGVGHITNGNLMAPTYSSTIWLPQNGDRLEVLARYPVLTPTPTPPTPTPPPPTPVPSPLGPVFIDKEGNAWRWTGGWVRA